MVILITGAAGFLGHAFWDGLRRRYQGREDLDFWLVDKGHSAAGVPMDSQDLQLWLDDFDLPVDLAFHFAAPKDTIDAVRVDSVFFRWARDHAKVIIYPSSAAVYPPRWQMGGAHPFLPETMFHPDMAEWGKPDGDAGFAKLAGERLAYQTGRNVLAIRPFMVYGPGQAFGNIVPNLARAVIERHDPLEVWGTGKQVRDWIYVDDVVDISLDRLETMQAGPKGFHAMNVCSGVGIPIGELASRMAMLDGYSPTVIGTEETDQGPFKQVGDPSQWQSRCPRQLVPLHEGLTRVLADVRARIEAEEEAERIGMEEATMDELEYFANL